MQRDPSLSFKFHLKSAAPTIKRVCNPGISMSILEEVFLSESQQTLFIKIKQEFVNELQSNT